MTYLAGAFGILAAVLFTIWAVRVSIRNHRRAQLWNRLESVIEQHSEPEATLTPEEIAQFHAMRWMGD